jgi:hypothetical protein
VEVRIAPGGDRVGETLSQSDAGRGAELEIRQVFEAEDFGAEFRPERREQEERLRVETRRTKPDEIQAACSCREATSADAERDKC